MPIVRKSKLRDIKAVEFYPTAERDSNGYYVPVVMETAHFYKGGNESRIETSSQGHSWERDAIASAEQGAYMRAAQASKKGVNVIVHDRASVQALQAAQEKVENAARDKFYAAQAAENANPKNQDATGWEAIGCIGIVLILLVAFTYLMGWWDFGYCRGISEGMQLCL